MHQFSHQVRSDCMTSSFSTHVNFHKTMSFAYDTLLLLIKVGLNQV
jgi:hypothetical protein